MFEKLKIKIQNYREILKAGFYAGLMASNFDNRKDAVSYIKRQVKEKENKLYKKEML